MARRAAGLQPDLFGETPATPEPAAATAPPRRYVVYYLMDRRYRATRHVETCGVLRRAQAAIEEGAVNTDRFTDHHVVTDDVWARLPDYFHTSEPKQHSCLKH